MRAVSASSVTHDPYRAGLDIGEAMAAIAPEVVFLFSSIHYALPDLLEGLYDGLDNDKVVVVGNSGDGCFGSEGVLDYGVAALAMNSDGAVRWRLERIGELNDGLDAQLAGLLERLAGGGETPCLAYLVSDFRVDVGALEASLHERARFPIVGGLAMDDRRGQSCFLYINREVVSDALVVLAAYGDLRFSIAVANTQRRVGRAARIESAEGNQIHRIDGMSAADFIERETGKPVLQSDRGVLSVKTGGHEAADEQRLRSIMLSAAPASGSLGFFGGVHAGDTIQVCQANSALMVEEMQAIGTALHARELPAAGALVISCTGRKAFLGALIEREVGELKNAFAATLPLAGFPSRGEIAPLARGSGYTANLYHNMTCVVVMFWR